MELTYIGIIVALVGLYILLFGRVRSAIFFLVCTAILMGSAAVSLPALGGSSIPVVQFALLFTTLKILTPRGGYHGLLPDAFRDNRWLIVFAVFGVAMAYLGPRIFADTINVFPMQPPASLGPFDTVPLQPTAQNVTGAFYIFGALVLGLSGYVFSRMPDAGRAIVGAVLLAGWFHLATGVTDIVTRGTGMEGILDVFRNANYSALDHQTDGFVRIRGVQAEASVYATQGFILFVTTAEMWYRSIRPRATGLVAGLLALVLVISTASTAYVSLAVYAAFFITRATLFPSAAPRGKVKRAAIAGFALLCVLSAIFIVVPQVLLGIWELVTDMTLGKPQSFSGQQRLFWALQGWDAFLASYGLGIGPGSFRSSSIVTAILGSVGVLGATAFVLYLASVFQVSRRSSWGIGPTPRETLGGALGSAALLSLVPAAVSAPHPVPAALVSLFAGAAIALRKGAPQPLGAQPRPATPIDLRRKEPETVAPAGIRLGRRPVAGTNRS